MSFKQLDPLLHSQLRLAIMSLLIGVEKAGFQFLLEETESTKGNLSVQLKKLKEAGYIEIHKSFKGSYPHTEASVTQQGRKAFEKYVNTISEYLDVEKND